MNDNIIVASFTDGRHETRTRRVYQYDYGMVLNVDGITLPTAFEAHFSNTDDSGTSVTQIGSDSAVTIPDEYLLTGLPVYCWIYLHSGEDDGETVYKITIPVKRRAQPTNEEPTPVQQDAITQAIAALNSAVTQTGQDADSAEASASDAADSAEEAKGYKEAAETAATEAAASATTASQKATQAGNFMIDAGRAAEVAEGDARIASQSANTARIQAQSAQASAQAAQASAQSIQSMSVEAETLAPGSQATAEWSDGTLSLGIPRGDKGLKGDPGDPGDPGFSPTATVSKSGTATTITVTDETGTTTATVLDGAKGDPGDPGEPGDPGIPGVSPTITVTDITGGHRVTITDADHPGGISFDVPDGAPGEGVPSGGTTGQILKKSSGTDYDTEWGEEAVKGVKINGTSIVDANGDADIPIAGVNKLGAVATAPSSTGGITVNQTNGRISTFAAVTSELKAGSDFYKPVVPHYQHESAFYALAKAAGDTTQSASSNTVGTYTDAAKHAIQKMLGVYEAPWELIREDTGTNATPADIVVTADANGQSFELTDIRLVFYTPVQDTEAVVGDYGRVYFYYGSGSTQRDILYMGAYTQAAQASTKVSALQILQNNGMIERTMWKNNAANSERTPISILNGNLGTNTLWEMTKKTYTKMLISTITGTWSYKLYGRRKWQ